MFLKWLYQILLDERGEDAAAAGGEGSGDTSATGGEGDAPGAGDSGAGGDAGQGDNPPAAAPAFGEFGDIPQTQEEAIALAKKVYEAHTRIVPEYETLRGKTAATERNLATLRKSLERTGIRAVQGEDGEVTFEVINQPKQERQKRFQDTHKALFDQKVLEAMQALIDDRFDEQFDTRQKAYHEQSQRQQVSERMRNQAVGLMFSYFPQLNGKWDADNKPTSATFDANFHKRAEEIWKERYPNDPRGELLAALEAARELGISANAIKQAEKAGFQKGKEEKKILGPVGQGGAAAAGRKGTLTKEEYLALSPEKKLEHDQQQFKATGG